MDDASRAALRQTVEVALALARRALAERHDALAEARAAAALAARSEAALRAERARYERDLRAVSGHTLSGADLREMRRRGDALAARIERAARGREVAGAAVARAELQLEEGRRAVGEQLARQRWIDAEAHSADQARARQAERREDED